VGSQVGRGRFWPGVGMTVIFESIFGLGKTITRPHCSRNRGKEGGESERAAVPEEDYEPSILTAIGGRRKRRTMVKEGFTMQRKDKWSCFTCKEAKKTWYSNRIGNFNFVSQTILTKIR